MDTIHIVGVVVQVEDLLVEAMEVEVEDIVVEEMEVELEDLLAEDMEVQLEVTHSNVYYFIFSSVNKQAKRLKSREGRQMEWWSISTMVNKVSDKLQNVSQILCSGKSRFFG